MAEILRPSSTIQGDWYSTSTPNHGCVTKSTSTVLPTVAPDLNTYIWGYYEAVDTYAIGTPTTPTVSNVTVWIYAECTDAGTDLDVSLSAFDVPTISTGQTITSAGWYEFSFPGTWTSEQLADTAISLTHGIDSCETYVITVYEVFAAVHAPAAGSESSLSSQGFSESSSSSSTSSSAGFSQSSESSTSSAGFSESSESSSSSSSSKSSEGFSESSTSESSTSSLEFSTSSDSSTATSDSSDSTSPTSISSDSSTPTSFSSDSSSTSPTSFSSDSSTSDSSDSSTSDSSDSSTSDSSDSSTATSPTSLSSDSSTSPTSDSSTSQTSSSSSSAGPVPTMYHADAVGIHAAGFAS